MGSSHHKGPTSMPVPPKQTLQMPSSQNGGKKSSTWIYVLIGLVILGGLWYLLTQKPEGTALTGTESEEEQREDEENTNGGSTLRSPSFLWEFSPAGGDSATGASRTEVTLSVNGDARTVGTFDGSCLVINGSSWQLAENELTGVICWFGGAGDEIGVFYENGTYVVKQGVLEEGIEGESGMRGGYETLFTL